MIHTQQYYKKLLQVKKDMMDNHVKAAKLKVLQILPINSVSRIIIHRVVGKSEKDEWDRISQARSS